jgi:hypothetical protein
MIGTQNVITVTVVISWKNIRITLGLRNTI